MTPVVNGLMAEYQGEVEFLVLNAASGEGKKAFDDFGLPGHPSFVIIDGQGEFLWRAFGPQSREAMLTEIQKAIQSSTG